MTRRAQKDHNEYSLDQIKKSVKHEDVHYDYSMAALKNKHAKWVGSALKEVEERGLFRTAFKKVVEAQVGYVSWSDDMIENQHKDYNQDKPELLDYVAGTTIKVVNWQRIPDPIDCEDAKDDSNSNSNSSSSMDLPPRIHVENDDERRFYVANRKNIEGRLLDTYRKSKKRKAKNKQGAQQQHNPADVVRKLSNAFVVHRVVGFTNECRKVVKSE